MAVSACLCLFGVDASHSPSTLRADGLYLRVCFFLTALYIAFVTLTCVDVCWHVLMCVDMCWCAFTCWCALLCVETCWFALLCVEMCWCALMCVEMCWCVLMCVEMCWCALMCVAGPFAGCAVLEEWVMEWGCVVRPYVPRAGSVLCMCWLVLQAVRCWRSGWWSGVVLSVPMYPAPVASCACVDWCCRLCGAGGVGDGVGLCCPSLCTPPR